MKTDWLIVGAGFTGSVLAERIAAQLGEKVLLVEQRDHIAGYAYDYYDEHGILVHKYGPHIFHANDRHVWDYLSRFTEWRSYYHHVLGVVDGKQVPIPFNLNSLYSLFPPRHADRLAQQLIEKFGFGVKTPILKIREDADGELRFLADYIYEKVFRNYTQKQWDLTPEQLGPSVTGRVPVYISRDDRYFQDTYQGLPRYGYTEMFRRMLKHPNIKLLLNAPYQEIAREINYTRMIFTGPIDAYFDHIYGELPYRSLRFVSKYDEHEQMQSVGTVNYPNEYRFTRTTEFKHLTGQRCAGTSWIEEYPQVYRRGENDPYYPVPREENRALYKRYLAETEKLNGKVLFAGRLGEYQYYNMDAAVAKALDLFDKRIK
ncbi:MAG: UDP-galactopyranose mutase [Gammaproteobacteria bacterium]|nr:UDP-galactopyranose mutase [Gammaproteobacteria bacterium]